MAQHQNIKIYKENYMCNCCMCKLSTRFPPIIHDEIHEICMISVLFSLHNLKHGDFIKQTTYVGLIYYTPNTAVKNMTSMLLNPGFCVFNQIHPRQLRDTLTSQLIWLCKIVLIKSSQHPEAKFSVFTRTQIMCLFGVLWCSSLWEYHVFICLATCVAATLAAQAAILFLYTTVHNGTCKSPEYCRPHKR